MLVSYGKALARQWVKEQAGITPGLRGAFFHGSINELPDDAFLSKHSDIDIMIVVDRPNPPDKLGKLMYGDVLLDVTYLTTEEVQSAEQILGQYHMAGSFRRPGIILDPSGQLEKLQAVVSDEFTKRKWVLKRCEHARDKVINTCRLQESDPLYKQVFHWVFPAGITTHILLAAGLKNPTVRKRYMAVRSLLEDYGFMGFYPTLLNMLGCNQLTMQDAKRHLKALGEVFDTAKSVIRSPFPYASDISDLARPIAIDGSLELIERGYHGEAVFWIVVTYSRCQEILAQDGSIEMRDWSEAGYRSLLADLGIQAYADLKLRTDQIKELLPSVYRVAEAITAANAEIC